MTVTKQLAVVGDPVSHSLSPLIHNRWIGEAGLDAHYSALRLQAGDAAPDLREMRQTYFGLNITLPHKMAALKAATKSSPEAQAVGAANTLSHEPGGGWFAHNTDIAGFSEAFRHALGTKVQGSRVILIGAGGAARAVAFHLSSLGVELAIVNRTRANAETLAKELAPKAAIAGLGELQDLAASADMVINSASLGHSGETLPTLPAGKGRPFLDLSYGKAALVALESAQEAGWKPHDGLRMLVGQAAAAFKIWFGTSPDSDGALSACQAAVAART